MLGGKGTQSLPDGSIYEGDWVGDSRHGKGKLTLFNGDIYEGNWVDDKYRYDHQG